jgi:hypothetical protein
MTYDEFKKAWGRALRESGLPLLGASDVTELLDLRSLDRKCESFVEPVGGQPPSPSTYPRPCPGGGRRSLRHALRLPRRICS